MSDVSRETPQPVPEIVHSRYPEAAARLEQLHDLLADAGVERGLIGPREVPRLWDRHLLNCAVVAELIPHGTQTLLDVGSGAGLPGLVLALVRPEITVTLLEPLERRSLFLQESVGLLGLGQQVSVVRGRAEEMRQRFDVVTARAVAPMDRLAGWCLPVVAPGGRLLAMKGAKATLEATEARAAFPAWAFEVTTCGAGVVSPETTVVVATMGGSA